MKKVVLNQFTTYELESLFAQQKFDSVIMTFGSCESHGDHLPLGTDTFVPEKVAELAAQNLDKTLVVPCVPFGTSMGYNANPLAITLRFETVTAIAEDMLESVIKYGIKHIMILNGHDGNIAPLEIALRKTKAAHPDVTFAFIPAWWMIVGSRLGKDFFEEWNGLGHGGEGESSITMAVVPQWCDLSKAKRQMPTDSIRIGETAQIIWNIDEVSETGATGDPTLATPEKGQAMLEALVDIVVSTIDTLDSSEWKYDRLKSSVTS